MIIENLKQPPFNTTLMGVLRGVIDYYGIRTCDPVMFGGSGHAFLMNIHKELCPSGPYCWDRTGFYKLVRNLGIEMVDEGFFHAGSSESERAVIARLIVENLDNGVPCSLMNMENQLITGYDDTGLITAQPWPGMDFPPKHLAFGSWAEIIDDCHINFFTFHKVEPADMGKMGADCLKYAVDMYRHPEIHTSEAYGVGSKAYSNWITAVKNGHGSSHGNWWNATVWSECRGMASQYFEGFAAGVPEFASLLNDLAADYAFIADALGKVSDKELAIEPKIDLLEQAAARESVCIEKIEELLKAFGA